MIGALGTFKAALVLVAGTALGAAGAAVFGALVTVPAAREAGALTERVVHEEQRRRAQAKAIADQDAAQAEIDRIEADFHRRDAERAAGMADLEAALQEIPVHETAPSSPRGACRLVVPRGVSERLDRIGRPAARPHPAEPDAGLR